MSEIVHGPSERLTGAKDVGLGERNVPGTADTSTDPVGRSACFEALGDADRAAELRAEAARNGGE